MTARGEGKKKDLEIKKESKRARKASKQATRKIEGKLSAVSRAAHKRDGQREKFIEWITRSRNGGGGAAFRRG